MDGEHREGETAVPDGPVGLGDAEDNLGVEDLKLRLGIKNNHLRELYERLATAEVVADESRVVRETAERRMEDLEQQRDRLGERVREFEEEERQRKRQNADGERQAARTVREMERRDAEISRLTNLFEDRERELELLQREAEDRASRDSRVLENARRRIERLEGELEERETEAADLRSTMDSLREELEAEYERQRRLAEPANRLRAGIDLFNESKQIGAVHSLSRDLGRPEVHAVLDDGEEPPVILTFTWQGIAWQTYAANPGIAVEEPRVYLVSAGEDLSGVDRKPPNARLGPGGRVVLGL